MEGPGVGVKERTCKQRPPPRQLTAKEAICHSNEIPRLVSDPHLRLCLTVVKPTEVPTEPPTLPPPATVPPALDGKDIWAPELPP